ncbi:MAG TPA: hypothetical protein VD997_16385 [Phycisphaerales bacterium]|nr:hypothetical protein [Phycisphaerales bacterium]
MGWTLRSSPDPRLIEYLRENDVKCPRCRYNLRGLETNECPECGDTLVLSLLRSEAARWSVRWHLAYMAWCGVLAATQVWIGLKVLPHMENPPGVVAAMLFGSSGKRGHLWLFPIAIGWVLVGPHLKNEPAHVSKPVALGVATLITLLVLGAALALLP